MDITFLKTGVGSDIRYWSINCDSVELDNRSHPRSMWIHQSDKDYNNWESIAQFSICLNISMTQERVKGHFSHHYGRPS